MRKKGLRSLHAFVGIAGLCLTFLPVVWASPAERISRFHSQITVHGNGSMTVRETVQVHSEGMEIRHGIYRDFPTVYKDRFGHRYVVDFSVQEVLRDGLPEAHHLAPRSNGIRVYIGQKEVVLPPGDYTYTLTYLTDRQLGFFKDHDELYWNVTGTGWVFPMEEVSAAVTLPRDVRRERIALDGFTGPQGSRAKEFQASVDEDGTIHFSTTQGLQPHEGLTIVVSWPKGVVPEPTVLQKFGYLLRDNRILIIGLLGSLLLLAYYLAVWFDFGRDPAKGTVVPLYDPPEGTSPAAMRYIMKMGFDHKVFAAAVINMAVKKCLSIREDKGVYTLTRAQTDAGVLAPEEEKIADALLNPLKTIELKQENHSRIAGALEAVRQSLQAEYEETDFVINRIYFAIGLVISVAVTGLTWAAIGTGGVVPLSVIIVLAILVFINFLFYHLLKAPTYAGRALMDKIEGFKLFLAATEKDRLNVLNPPEKTPELFERYLPYALALDVEQAWAQQFAELFSRMAQDGNSYTPIWYSGTHWGSFDTGSFASSLGSSLSGAIAASSTAPGSSSGGGGFSGGGGGGGGGGGW